jgi:hypothetical protein
LIAPLYPVTRLKDILFPDQIVLEGKDDDPGRILYIHFFQDARTVTFYGTLAEEQLVTYLLCCMLTADELDDLAFPFREKVP